MRALGNRFAGHVGRTGVRITVLCVAVALFVIACHGNPPRTTAPTPPVARTPENVAIDLDPKLEEQLALGLPMRVQLETDKPIGECTLVYNLWDEEYAVALSKTDIAHVADVRTALRRCLPRDVFAPSVRVREMPHLYQPRSDYPVF